MSNKLGPLHIVICDDGYQAMTNGGQANYTLKGTCVSRFGDPERLPESIQISDCRSLPSPINVSATPVLWGAKVEWEWPKEADNSWYAAVRSEYSESEETNYQAGKTKFPESTYQVTGVPAGKNINLQVTLHDGNGKRSKPIQLSAKSSDDATAIVCDTFKILGGQVFINNALIGSYRQSQVGSFHSNGEIRYCDVNGTQRVRVQVGVNTAESMDKDEHSPMTLADCKKRFGDSEPIPFGGFPMPKRKVRINIAGLQQWKNGIVSGAEVRVDIIQNGKCIHSEVFSGKATQPFTREIEISASFDDIVAVHNRPDLKELKVSAEFADVKREEESDFGRMKKIINNHISERLNKELQPGGLLHKR